MSDSDLILGSDEIVPSARVGRYRWVVCGLLFYATTVNYMDRNVLAVLEPTLREKIGWNAVQYGNITAAFSAAYAVGLLGVGGIIDRLGTRLGYPLFMALWGLASISHAFATTVLGFAICRVFLGLFEAANFPAAVKTVAEWFPRKERSLAIGIFNSGANIGSILAPLIIPVVVLATAKATHDRFSWQPAFCIAGVLEIIWIAFWFRIYRSPQEHPRLGAAELSYIQSDPMVSSGTISWLKILPHRQTWAFALGKCLTDPVWWFWIFWSVPYLHDRFGIDIKHIGLPLIVIYNLATFGSIFGGWIAAGFSRVGFNMNVSRKLALLFCGLCVVPVTLAPSLNNQWEVICLIGLAAAAHQGFSANLFALSGDLFPRHVVGSVVGIGGTAGAVSGIILPIVAGHIVQRFHTYAPLFVFAGSAYLVAVALIQTLAPTLELANIEPAEIE